MPGWILKMTWTIWAGKEARIMDNKHYIFFCNRCCRPIDKFDVAIAKIALFAVKFTLFLIIAFAVLLMIIF